MAPQHAIAQNDIMLDKQQVVEHQQVETRKSEVAQPKVAFRTNLLYDATLSPNIGVELYISPKMTLGLLGGINVWDVDKQENKKWRHLLVAPNMRRYHGFKRDTLCTYGYLSDGSYGVISDSIVTRRVRYWEADLIYSHFNASNTRIPFGLYAGVKDRRLQGDLVALGAKYGYSWILSRTWRVEAEAGVAIGYAWFKEYDCPHCGSFLGNGDRIFLLPQLGINVVFVIN